MNAKQRERGRERDGSEISGQGGESVREKDCICVVCEYVRYIEVVWLVYIDTN